MALPDKLSLRIYRDMIRSRTLDEQLIKNARGGVMRTPWHSGIGQEAIVGPIALLRREDYVTYTHRGPYVWVTKGMDMKEVLAEFYGKITGCAKGKGGTHVAKPSLGIFGRAGSQGGHFVLALGMAISAKMKGEGQVVISCFGDGCGTRGTLHEAMNHASIHKLPIVWLCENNGYSMSVGIGLTWAVKDIAAIAPGYGMPGTTVDGNDVIAVTEAAQKCIDRAREGKGPSLLEMKTYRLRGHFEGHTTRYMPKEEIEAWRKRDPIRIFEQALLAQGLLQEKEILATKAAAMTEVQEAQRFAEESPFPSPGDGLSDLYAE